jgi:nucleotide-binding universal stress UspA family protein
MYRHLLVPADGTELSERAMRTSVALARCLAARITGLIVEPGATLVSGHSASHYLDQLHVHADERVAHAREVMSRFSAMAQADGVDFSAHYVCTGLMEDAIVEVARREGCDLLVMGTHSRTGFDRLVHGSHTHAVLARTRLPVLVLR